MFSTKNWFSKLEKTILAIQGLIVLTPLLKLKLTFSSTTKFNQLSDPGNEVTVVFSD